MSNSKQIRSVQSVGSPAMATIIRLIAERLVSDYQAEENAKALTEEEKLRQCSERHDR